MDNFDAWIGRSQERDDYLDPWRAKALAATLGSHPQVEDPEALPCLWHWLYFVETADGSQLAHDGHARRGLFMPPIDLERRMFAGGRNIVHKPLRLGAMASVKETILKIAHKPAAGLYVVTVGFDYSQDGALCVSEERDIIYIGGKPSVAAADSIVPAPSAQWAQDVTPDEVMLFRYSALTFNGHRIHYDRTYVQDEEGYPDIVVHGPLTATLLAELARAQTGKSVTQFAFRAQRPLFVNAPVRLRGGALPDGTLELVAYGLDGEPAMSATASV